MILKNAKIVDDSFRFADADVAVEEDKISEIAPGLAGGEEIDLSGCVLVPGFVDIHIHACVGADTCDADADGLAKMCAHLVTKGVTSFCPTTMTVSHKGILRALETVKSCMDHPPKGAAIAGVNMEGPYISIHKKGAQKGEFVKNSDFKEFQEFYDACGGIIKLVDIAPECPGAEEFIPQASRLCTVSIAHTEADYACAKHAFELGITHATHLYNAMPGMKHREPGVIGAVLDDPRVRAELICDGFHIHPAVLRITFEALGKDRVVIVSDSMRAAGAPDGVSELGGQTVYVKDGQARLKDGTIAGSTTNLHQEIKNLVGWGVPFLTAIQAATLNPARAIHEDERIGSIKVGKYADMVALDSDLNIRMVVARGKIAVNNNA
ncbi:N-acetylglucosamine-6-phosphate deacetylase [Caproiciproducens galactitolivorans]|uniref:N-acetylglucosamine-6-phosphate deacetylase n=1 Tax=Caproiciproducens galactitolivorans TaxID=642589 RepID=UPI00240A1526|nr:N-acetylglucosamine-6-phosphate deacetylase [Caproiciproducens galactitolivorans]